MNRGLFSPVIAALLLCVFATSVASAATPAEVEATILKAKQHLYSLQHNGNWESGDLATSYPGGQTAIAIYALLASGESQKDPRLAGAVNYLKTVNTQRTYAVAIRCLVWSLWDNKQEIRPVLMSDARALASAGDPGRNGLYSYIAARGGGKEFDCSNSQYGALGVWAAEQSGFEVSRRYWQTVEQSWRTIQCPDGGWRYQFDSHHPDSSPSMTAAGIATLFVAQDELAAGVGAECRGNVKNPAIDRGLAWMAENFRHTWGTYAWYGVARIGIASGYKYIGPNDWYAVGAEKLVRDGVGNEDWKDQGDLPGTAFGLLFLARGRAPVAMNKLKYAFAGKDSKEVEGNWDQRPRDAANLSQWIGKQIESELNWQVVDFTASPEDLHDAPLLYITGDQALAFDDEQVRKLKTFIEQGGIILGNADCGSDAFAESFRKLGAKMFPSYEFRDLPPTHPILADEQWSYSKKRLNIPLQGLSNGARELMLLIPRGDPARYLQAQMYRGHEDAYKLFDDIFLYATGKSGLRTKGDTYVVKADPKLAATATIRVARLKYDGNWDPEPGGWSRLAAVMHNQRKLDLDIQTVPLGEGKLSDYRVAHLTGTAAIKLSDPQRQELQKFVHGGGTLIVDAAGGSRAFATAASAELHTAFGEGASQLDDPLDMDQPLFQSDGKPLKVANRGVGASGERPKLRGISLNDRLAIVFSPGDLSVGLVGQPIDGVMGYEPATATAIVSDIVAAAANPPATEPSH